MSGAGRGRKSTFDLGSPYNSQSLAAGGSALLDAINRGKVHLAKFILDAGEYDAANVRDFKGKTPLIRACYIRVSYYTTYHQGVCPVKEMLRLSEISRGLWSMTKYHLIRLWYIYIYLFSVLCHAEYICTSYIVTGS